MLNRRKNERDFFDIMRDEMETMFGDFMDDFGFFEANPLFENRKMLSDFSDKKALANKEQTPKYRKALADYWETDNEIVATVKLPGVDKKDIDINLEDDSLEIKVEKKQEDEKKDKNSYSYMKTCSGFYRRIPLPEFALSEKAKATYNNGVLEVRIPKKELPKKEKKKLMIE